MDSLEKATFWLIPAIALIVHVVLRRKDYFLASAAGAVLGPAICCFVISPLTGYGVSNSWPIACGFWIIYAFFPALFIGLPVRLLMAPREIPAGHCQSCGYDLRNLSEPRCPECGTPFAPQKDTTKEPGP